MHKYIPRLHIIQAINPSNNDAKLSMTPFDNVNVFVFPETQFIAVTAYQNEEVKEYLFKNETINFIFVLGYSVKN